MVLDVPFQTSSSGLISGEYGGRKNSRRRSFTWVHEAMHRLGLVCGQSVDDEKRSFSDNVVINSAQELDEQRR